MNAPVPGPADDPHHLGAALAFAEHDAGASPSGPWRPLVGRLSDDGLRARVDQVATALGFGEGGRVDLRVAASTEHFGLVARLVAAHICARALDFSISLAVADTWWQQPPGSLVQLSVTRSTHPRNPLSASAIEALTASVERLYGVSGAVLWGNVGSAANSTLNLLRMARPGLVAPAREAADAILADRRVDGGILRSGPAFRRRSCCLIYRAGTALCGDCVLNT